MIVNLIVGLLGFAFSLIFGFSFINSIIVFLFAFILDVDILVNEFLRIFVKKEKRFKVDNILDEYFYTHKYIFHLPLVIIPIVFVIGLLYMNFLFAFLISSMVLWHLFHDTIDNNFDGVSWLWPFNSDSYKIEGDYLIIKTRKELREEANQKKVKNPRSYKKILKDNTVF